MRVLPVADNWLGKQCLYTLPRILQNFRNNPLSHLPELARHLKRGLGLRRQLQFPPRTQTDTVSVCERPRADRREGLQTLSPLAVFSDAAVEIGAWAGDDVLHVGCQTAKEGLSAGRAARAQARREEACLAHAEDAAQAPFGVVKLLDVLDVGGGEGDFNKA